MITYQNSICKRSEGRNQRGFTIVELLIVIVVIAILATISIVAYTGVQVRARDSMRTDAIAKIRKALELYKVNYGQYPNATAVTTYASGWEVSDEPNATFMEYLAGYGFPGGTPVDPINDSTYRIFYYRYPPGGGGTAGCDVSRGGFYVLRLRYESVNNKPQGNPVAGDECTTINSGWVESGSVYVFHAYENY